MKSAVYEWPHNNRSDIGRLLNDGRWEPGEGIGQEGGVHLYEVFLAQVEMLGIWFMLYNFSKDQLLYETWR